MDNKERKKYNTEKYNQHKHKHNGLFQKVPSLTFLHILYTNTNINTNACFQNFKYNMCTYRIQQHIHKHNQLLPK